MKLHEVAGASKRSGTLYVFDIDDTLFRTTAQVRVIKDGEPPKTLTSQEFNDYKLKPGERFDYGEFVDAEKFNTESKPIPKMIQTLVRVHDKVKLNLTPGSKVIISTARGILDDQDTFDDTFRYHGIDIDNIEANHAEHGKGSSPAERKNSVARRYLSAHDYDACYMYDDSKTNLTYFLQLKHEFPEVDFRAFIINDEGEMHQFTAEAR